MNIFCKTYIVSLLVLLTGLFFTSCGEDRTYQYEEKTEKSQWIYKIMNQYYLWYKEMPSVNDYKIFFNDPKTFFYKLLSKKDKYSYIEMEEDTRSINSTSTYGFDFMLYVDPVTQSQSSTTRYARVLYVLSDSPAKEAGLKRGDWISAINGESLTQKNYMALVSGGPTTLTISTLNYQRPDSIYWEETTQTLTLQASRKVEDNPFFVDSVYYLNGKHIGYLMYNKFSTGPDDTGDETQYAYQMQNIFSRFKGENLTDFILDLRYNPGGYLTCAQQLGSLIAPDAAMGNVFCSLEFNDKQGDLNQKYLFDKAQASNYGLNLQRIYIITSEQTASASETLINSLIPFLGKENIILVGEKTEGKNVASLTFESPYNFKIQPIVATVYNSEGLSDYANGFSPDYEIDEALYINNLAPLGDINEIMLNTTLGLILDITKKQTRNIPHPILQPTFNSIELKTKGNIVK